MAVEWPLRPFGELTDNFDAIRVPVKEAERKPGPYPYYGASGVVDHVNGYLFDGEYLLIAEDGENLRTIQTPIAFMATGKFWVNNHAHIVRGNAENDTRYLMYAMRLADISAYLTGSTMPKLTQGNMNRVPVIAPPLPEQRAIAGVLGALDDKIEVNRKTARVLEGIARAVFTSWFVDFDPVRRPAAVGLPGHLAALFSTRLVDSPIGEVPEIPEGWTASRLTDQFNLTMGQSPPGSTYNETGEGLPFYQGRTDYGFRFPTPRVYCTAPTRFAEPGDTLVSVRAPVGDVNMAIERCAVGRGVAAVRHKSGSRSLTYYAMHALRAHFLRFEADGTVFGAIGKTDFERLPFVAPPPPIVAAFEKFAAPIDHRIEGCERQSATLAALRDTLLPRLISGELRIAEAEKIVGRAV